METQLQDEEDNDWFPMVQNVETNSIAYRVLGELMNTTSWAVIEEMPWLSTKALQDGHAMVSVINSGSVIMITYRKEWVLQSMLSINMYNSYGHLLVRTRHDTVDAEEYSLYRYTMYNYNTPNSIIVLKDQLGKQTFKK